MVDYGHPFYRSQNVGPPNYNLVSNPHELDLYLPLTIYSYGTYQPTHIIRHFSLGPSVQRRSWMPLLDWAPNPCEFRRAMDGVHGAAAGIGMATEPRGLEFPMIPLVYHWYTLGIPLVTRWLLNFGP